jgi:hypothetical protein
MARRSKQERSIEEACPIVTGVTVAHVLHVNAYSGQFGA